MSIRRQIKDSSLNTMRLMLWCLRFIKNGTLYPTIKTIKPNNDRIFIFGNGPSLNADIAPHIPQLQNEDVLIINKAITTSLAQIIKPKYYIILDPAFFGISYAGENPQYSKEYMEALGALRNVDWEMNVCMPYMFYSNKHIQSICKDNPFIYIKTFNALELYTFKSIEKLFYKQNLAIPSGINVLIASLCCAITMGYKSIYLLGADSNFTKMLNVDEDNRLYYVLEHFYKKEKKVFFPMSIADNLSCVVRAFKAYEELGVLDFGIINLTSTSMIDAFPRDKLENVLNGGGGL